MSKVGVGFELHRGQYEIWVDDKSAGSIEWQQHFELPLDPGHHTLQIRRGRYSSQTRRFDVADGQAVDFRCHGARIWPTYVLSLAKPDLGISLRQE
ncbi:MAG: hypothetical protein ACRD0J_11085 [Acidimicrobiales bacterium]